MLFISKINNLKFKKPLGKDIPIRDGCYLTNDSNIVEGLFLKEAARHLAICFGMN